MLAKFAACILACFLLGSAKGKSSGPQDAYDRVNECMREAFTNSEELKRAIEGSENYQLKLTDYYEQVFRRCLVRPFESSEGSKNILDFFRLFFWQMGILEKKSNIYPNITHLDELKSLVEQSEILQSENLESIENDIYAQCAGDAYSKCIKRNENVWEQGGDELGLFFLFFDCFEREADSCPPDMMMMKHLKDLVEAFKKHMLENHSRLAEIMEQISH